MGKLKNLILLFFFVFSLSLTVVSSDVFALGTMPTLGTAASYAVLGASTVTNTGNSILRGDLGLSPGASVTGFPPGIVVPPGTTHIADAAAAQAQVDATTAYNNITGQACDFGPFGPTDLAGQTLVPGVYCYSSSVQNTGTLTLNGLPTDVWVFKIGTTLTTGSGSSVVGTGSKCNMLWQVGSSATLGTTTTFKGSIIADQSISINNGVTFNGRALALNGAVTLINDTIDATGCAVGLSKDFSPSSITVGSGVSTLTITFSNSNTTGATLTSNFTDNLPGGILIAGTPSATTTCGGVGALIANPGGSYVTMSAGRIIPGTGTCTLSVNVTSPLAGSYINTLASGVLLTSVGNNFTSASATLSSINGALSSPTIATVLSSASVTVGSTVHDSATLSGATGTAGGTVTYTEYTDSACTLNGVTAGTQTVASGVVPDSNNITFNLTGTYYWQAVYSGDTGNNGAISTCASEALTVNKATPMFTTTGSGPVAVGGNITDTAHLGGGYGTLGGTLTFDVFAPGDTTCSTSIAVIPGVTVIGAGNFSSANFATTSVGIYRWIAHYSGDANNNAVDAICNDAGETSMVNLTMSILPPTGTTTSGVLPGTGYAPQRVTALSIQPAEKTYSDLGDLWLEIPSLGVQMPIVGVPPSANGWDVTWLSDQAGWLQGTAFPTWAGNSVLTGHVYDANGNLGPFGHLTWLSYGDRIVIHFGGQQYVYEVRSLSTVAPNAVSSVIRHENLPWITLVTCKGYDEKSNSYKYRTVVRAVQVEVE